MKTFRFLAPVLVALLVLVLAFTVLPQARPAPAYAAPMLARTTITPTAVTSAGITQTLVAAHSDGNDFLNNGATWVVIANGYTSGVTATFVTPRTIDGLAVADKTVLVSAGETFLAGPFGATTFNQSDGSVYVNFSTVTSVTVGAFYLR